MNPAAAANVGLRRAQGRFVSPKAADTYLSDEIIATIARRDLHENALYRCDRCDVTLSARDLEKLDDDSLLARLESLDSTRHSRMPHPPQWYIRDLHTNACGDFLLMSRKMWHTVRGFPLDNTVLSLDCDSLIMHAAAALGSHEICLPPSCRIFKGSHARLFTNRITQVWSPWQSEARQVPGQAPLVAGADAVSKPVRLSHAQGRRCRKRSRSVDRAQLRQARRAMGARHPFRSCRSRRTGDWAINRSRKGYFAGRVGTCPATQPSHERRAGRFPGRRSWQPVARADERTAKPMLDVGGRPFLDYLLDEASRHGIKRALLLCGYRAGDLTPIYNGRTIRGMRIETVVETSRPAPPAPWRWRPTGSTRTSSSSTATRCSISTGWLFARARRRHHQAWCAWPLPAAFPATRYGRVVVDGPTSADFHRIRRPRTGRSTPASISCARRSCRSIGAAPCSLERDVLPGLATAGLIEGVRRRCAVHRHRHPRRTSSVRKPSFPAS